MEDVSELEDGHFYKENPKDKTYWYNFHDGDIGTYVFSFDKKKVYYLFQDYPDNMTPEEVALFDKENPFWAEFLSSRE